MPDTFKSRTTLQVGGRTYTIYSLEAAMKRVGAGSRLPYVLKILLENLLRNEDGQAVKSQDLKVTGNFPRLKARALKHTPR